MRLLFLIRSLESGGAERQLVELVKRLDPAAFDIAVVTFYGHGALAGELAGLPHVGIVNLGKRGRWDTLRFGHRLWRAARRFNPDVIHGYMPGANELSAVLGAALGRRVVWGVRASNVDLSRYDWTAPALFRAGAWLSRAADLIIVNSEAGRTHHAAHGYAASRMIVIPNGIDVDRFQRDDPAGAAQRRAWRVASGDRVIGIVGRIDPMKDHATFLRAARRLAGVRADVRFAVVGDGSAERVAAVRDLARDTGVFDRVIWMDDAPNMTSVYNALDIVTSASAFGEGFSNVIGEAMACERLPVATAVGDAPRIIGDAGIVVAARDDAALSNAWLALLGKSDEERRTIGQRARSRIVASYSAAMLARRTERALLRLQPVLSAAAAP